MRHYAIVVLSALGAALLGACHSGPSAGGADSTAEDATSRYRYFRESGGAVLQLLKQGDRYEGSYIHGGMPMPVSGELDSAGRLVLVSYVDFVPTDTLRGTFPQAGVYQGTLSDSTGALHPFSFQERYDAGTFHWAVYSLSDSLGLDSASVGPQARVDLRLLWPGKDFPAAGRALLTPVIAGDYFGTVPSLTDPLIILRLARDSFFTAYRAAAAGLKDQVPGASFNWFFNGQMSVVWNADSLVSLAFERYAFTGGAHGLRTMTYTVMDLRQDRILQLPDLFRPGYEEPLRQLLEAALRQHYDIPQTEPLNGPHGLLFDPQLKLPENFYATGTGLGFVYNPYEVAPYVVGPIELFLPYTALKPLLREPPANP